MIDPIVVMHGQRKEILKLRADRAELLKALKADVENITAALELGDEGKWQQAEIFLNNQRGIAEEAIAEPEGSR